MFDYFRNFSSNAHAHQVCFEDSPTEGQYNLCQSDDSDLHSRSQLRLKFDKLFDSLMEAKYMKIRNEQAQNMPGTPLQKPIPLYNSKHNYRQGGRASPTFTLCL